MKTIPFFNTFIDKTAFSSVCDTLRSTFLSEGKIVAKFESQIQKSLSISHVVAVNSGTSALHLALVLAGVRLGDEVIIPAQTFIATGLAVLYVGAKPVFADIQYETGNLDPREIEKKITKKTKAIIPVHWGGYPCDMSEILAIAKKHNLIVVEDAAHALGATYKGIPIGNVSPLTCFSFQAIKHLTTGDGGAISSKTAVFERHAKKLRWFGIDRLRSKQSILGEREFDLNEIGFKYHMNDYAAALGLANLKTLKKRIAYRTRLVQIYQYGLKNVSGIKLRTPTTDRSSAHWLFGLHVEKRERFIKALLDKGISTSVVHQGIDRYTIMGGRQVDLDNQRMFDKTHIHLPLHDSLSTHDVQYIIKTIKKGW